jgi:hypothetical protein
MKTVALKPKITQLRRFTILSKLPPISSTNLQYKLSTMSDNILLRASSLGNFIILPKEILDFILRKLKHDPATLEKLCLLCHLFNKRIFEVITYDMVSYPGTTPEQLGEFHRISKANRIGFLGSPILTVIQPNQSEPIEISPESLTMTCYGQKLLHATSKVVYLTLYPHKKPTEIPTFLEIYQFPKTRVLIVYNIFKLHVVLNSLSQENFKSLKHIIAIRPTLKGDFICYSHHLFPLCTQVKEVFLSLDFQDKALAFLSGLHNRD